MLPVPRESPVLPNLNSYYVDLGRLVEHCQGEIGSGVVHVQSATSEAAVYFDHDEVLNAAFRNGKHAADGPSAYQRILAELPEASFAIDVYAVDEEQIFLWSRMPQATPLYRDLSSDFTDLRGLLGKLCQNQRSGYVEVVRAGGGSGGLILFANGTPLAASLTAGALAGASVEEAVALLSEDRGGTYHAFEIDLTGTGGAPPEPGDDPPAGREVVSMLQVLLNRAEKLFTLKARPGEDFRTALNRKFLEKAETYEYLDPFAGELTYVNHELAFRGRAGATELVRGVVESLNELADEARITSHWKAVSADWAGRYASQLHGLAGRAR